MKKVVITGCGVITPIGLTLDTFWDSLIAGKSGVSPLVAFDASDFDSRIAGQVKDFDPSTILPPKEARRTARFVQFVLSAADQAVQQSGLNLESLDPYRIGTIVGSGIGSLGVVEKEYTNYVEKGPKKISPFLIPTMITNEAAGMVGIRFNAKGVNFCTVTACASGAHAIGEAFRYIQSGRTDVMLAGGTEACLTPMGVGGFCSIKALCKRNDEPQRGSRPFDKDREGFVMAEGAGVVVLEEYEHAKKRGAQIICELAGYGATCDAFHITAPNPTGETPARAMTDGLKEAGVELKGNYYINAHGTSTVLNDKMETNAIKLAYGSFAKDVHISSTKSMTGHTLGAAGAVETIVAALAVNKGMIPPTINYETPDPECDLDYTPNKAIELDVDVAVSNSLGFGGHNAAIVVKKLK